MAEHKPVPIDTANQITELHEQGWGVNYIGYLTGINSGTVKNVIKGVHRSYSDTLSSRQLQYFINTGFRPL